MVGTGERRTIPLEDVRADGWLEKLSTASSSFEQLCDIVGERFVAFSVIADVRVSAVAVDQVRPEASVVDFQIGDSSRDHRLPLSEFRRRVAAAMLADEPPAPPLSDEPDTETLQAFIGVVTVLLAPVFGILLVALHFGDDAPPTITVEMDETSEEMSVERLRELIRDRVRADVQQARPPTQFSIDVEVVAEAEQANAQGDWERTIDLLGSWPGPLSLLMRTAEGQALEPPVRVALARGLGLLGTAYVQTGQSEWAEEIMRLGIQWSQDGEAAADLFRRLGEAYVVQERDAEAIGFFRRALALGAGPREVLPPLARCFASRGRYVAAAACLDEAEAFGVDREALAPVRAQLEGRLGESWSHFRDLVPVSGPERETAPPPSEE